MVHQVDEAKFCQQVGNELAARVLSLIQVHVEIYQHDRVLTPEALHELLYIRKVGQRSLWEACSNNRSLGRACDDLAAYHVQPAEEHQFKAPFHWPVPQYQPHAYLRFTVTIRTDRQANSVVSKPNKKIHHHGYLNFGEESEVKAAQFDCSNFLRYPKAPYVANVER